MIRLKSFFCPRIFPEAQACRPPSEARFNIQQTADKSGCFEMRPPLARYVRSSTVKMCSSCSQKFFTDVSISCIVFPLIQRSAACRTAKPYPNEAHLESMTRKSKSGIPPSLHWRSSQPSDTCLRGLRKRQCKEQDHLFRHIAKTHFNRLR